MVLTADWIFITTAVDAVNIMAIVLSAEERAKTASE